MDYKELIAWLQATTKDKCYKCEHCTEASNAIETLLAEREADGWISVQDRLPEEKGEYLVAYHPCYWDHISEETCVGIDSFRGKVAWAKKKYQRVTHWMPLPAPPEQNGKEG